MIDDVTEVVVRCCECVGPHRPPCPWTHPDWQAGIAEGERRERAKVVAWLRRSGRRSEFLERQDLAGMLESGAHLDGGEKSE